MIIQCRVCRTKYRFEETLLGAEGAWVRCTRCQNVFFQHPPLTALMDTAAETIAPDDVGRKEPLRETAPTPQATQHVPTTFPETNGPLPTGPDSTTPTGPELFGKEILVTTSLSPGGEDTGLPPEKAPSRSPGQKIRLWALGIVMLVLAAVGGALFVFPEYGQMIMGELHVLFPGLALTPAPESASPVVGPAQVRIVDVKQRFINNPLLGNIRVVEGLATNTSPYPMTRIRIRGELIDLAGAMVKETSAYCGNLLNDEELGIMSEEQIFRELAIPQGSDIPNDRIAPQGTIPFVLVLFREPPAWPRPWSWP